MFSDSYGNVDKLSTRLRLALRIAFQDQSQEEEREISSNYGVGMDIADFDANDALFGFENNFGVISEDDHLGYAVNTIILYQVSCQMSAVKNYPLVYYVLGFGWHGISN